jgi:hypothetical protein
MKHIVIVFLLASVITSCRQSCCKHDHHHPVDELKQLEWLLGSWQFEVDNALFAEEWSIMNDSTFKANGIMIIGEDTVTKESITLEFRNGILSYVVLVEGENDGKPVSFPLLSSTENKFVFENTLHDFPQRIIYEYVDEKSFTAIIEGEYEGEINRTELFMTKVDETELQ